MERRRLAVRGLGLAAFAVFFAFVDFAVFVVFASAVSSGSGRTSVT